MSYKNWILLNGLFFILFTMVLFSSQLDPRFTISIGKGLAQIAVVLFLINVSMYFIFTTIKKASSRNVKISMAKLSKKVFKPHIHLAIIGTTLILLHGSFMIALLGQRIGYFRPTMVTGYFAFILLILTLIGGYRRRQRASGPRRRFHLQMALAFAFVFLIHIAF